MPGDTPRFDPDTGAGGGRRTMAVVLPALPRSVAAARHAVGHLLEESEAVPGVVVEDILLLVSELVTNAVLHARTDTRVSASVEAGRVEVAVGDGDPRHAPFLAERGAMATNGRGVMLVDALASDWGIELHESSKVVWFVAAYDPGQGTEATAGPGDLGQQAAGRPRVRRSAQSA